MADECLFCGMASGQVPAEKVAENAEAFAVRDIHPRAPVHVLIIPKAHIATARAASDVPETIAAMFVLSNEAAEREGVAESGYRLAFNVGHDSGMTFEHLHMHLLGGRALGPEG